MLVRRLSPPAPGCCRSAAGEPTATRLLWAILTDRRLGVPCLSFRFYDIIMAELSLVLVTPERTLFDRPVASIRVPLFDGAAGFYPGRAPLVGRLGIGELRWTDTAGVTESYFIDGGFVQVKGRVVSVLTNSAVVVSELSRKVAVASLADARTERARSDDEYAIASRRLEKARKMMALASKD